MTAALELISHSRSLFSDPGALKTHVALPRRFDFSNKFQSHSLWTFVFVDRPNDQAKIQDEDFKLVERMAGTSLMRGIGGGDRRTTFRHYKGAKESGPGYKTRDLYLPWHFAFSSPNLTTSQVHESPRLLMNPIPFL